MDLGDHQAVDTAWIRSEMEDKREGDSKAIKSII